MSESQSLPTSAIGHTARGDRAVSAESIDFPHSYSRFRTLNASLSEEASDVGDGAPPSVGIGRRRSATETETYSAIKSRYFMSLNIPIPTTTEGEENDRADAVVRAGHFSVHASRFHAPSSGVFSESRTRFRYSTSLPVSSPIPIPRKPNECDSDGEGTDVDGMDGWTAAESPGYGDDIFEIEDDRRGIYSDGLHGDSVRNYGVSRVGGARRKNSYGDNMGGGGSRWIPRGGAGQSSSSSFRPPHLLVKRSDFSVDARIRSRGTGL